MEEKRMEETCYAVGLKKSFLHDFDFHTFPEDMQYHRFIDDWICIFLYGNYKKMIDDNDDLKQISETDQLIALGFRQDSMALKTICTRLNILQEHIKLIECAQNFIRDEFKYNVDLSTRQRSLWCFPTPSRPRSLFCFPPPHLNNWFTCPRIQSDKNTIQSCFIITLEKLDAIKSKISQLLTPENLEKEDSHLFFHGTDYDSTSSIFEEGIDPHCGSQKRDFSDGLGFYLIHDLNSAIRTAFGKTSKPAILIYQLPKHILKENFSKLSLCNKENETKWQTTVSQYRQGRQTKTLRQSVENIDFIEGPMASSYKLPPVAKEGSYQICALSEKFTEELDKYLYAIVFFKGIDTINSNMFDFI